MELECEASAWNAVFLHLRGCDQSSCYFKTAADCHLYLLRNTDDARSNTVVNAQSFLGVVMFYYYYDNSFSRGFFILSKSQGCFFQNASF